MAQQDQDTPRGLVLAITAYVLWGFLPLYLKLLDHIPPAELVAHRVIWSIPIAGAVLWALGRTKDLARALRDPRMLGLAALPAVLVSINWGIYIYAISTERTADAALGYYINPLFSMFLAATLLGERPTRLQLLSIAIAALAVIVLFVAAPAPPWIPLSLTFTWGFYALCKKSLPIGPNQGFMLEVLLLSIPALGYLIFLATQGQGVFLTNAQDTWVLLFAGVVTAVPLMFYANGAKLIRLSTAGILQYIAPSMIFICAIFVFGEKLDQSRLIAFPLIWTALVIYSVSMVSQMRRTSS